MEYLDIYDLAGNKTGKVIERSSDFSDLPENGRLLLVHVCVFNSRQEMLIQRRQLTKDRYPGIWDVSAGGFVASGEDSEQAIKRELREELGMDDLDLVIKFAHREPFGIVFDDFYIVRADPDIGELKFQEEEVMELAWADRDTVMAGLHDGTFVDYPEELIERMFGVGRGETVGE